MAWKEIKVQVVEDRSDDMNFNSLQLFFWWFVCDDMNLITLPDKILSPS
jgi:hypothetical protein